MRNFEYRLLYCNLIQVYFCETSTFLTFHHAFYLEKVLLASYSHSLSFSHPISEHSKRDNYQRPSNTMLVVVGEVDALLLPLFLLFIGSPCSLLKLLVFQIIPVAINLVLIYSGLGFSTSSHWILMLVAPIFANDCMSRTANTSVPSHTQDVSIISFSPCFGCKTA